MIIIKCTWWILWPSSAVKVSFRWGEGQTLPQCLQWGQAGGRLCVRSLHKMEATEAHLPRHPEGQHHPEINLYSFIQCNYIQSRRMSPSQRSTGRIIITTKSESFNNEMTSEFNISHWANTFIQITHFYLSILVVSSIFETFSIPSHNLIIVTCGDIYLCIQTELFGCPH